MSSKNNQPTVASNSEPHGFWFCVTVFFSSVARIFSAVDNIGKTMERETKLWDDVHQRSYDKRMAKLLADD